MNKILNKTYKFHPASNLGLSITTVKISAGLDLNEAPALIPNEPIVEKNKKQSPVRKISKKQITNIPAEDFGSKKKGSKNNMKGKKKPNGDENDNGSSGNY